MLEAVRRGDPPGEIWQRLPARRWWIYVALCQIAGVYYVHPYAWDEIGFGGPAYPRGYLALSHGAPEPWEPRAATSRRDRPRNEEGWPYDRQDHGRPTGPDHQQEQHLHGHRPLW